ncbi:LysR substrate-binding domain-containing protein [Rhizobium ruizarguesonis]
MLNMRSVDLNLLTTLQALLVEQSVSRAALKVGLSQPATSHALARLRELFKDALLERHGGQLRRTALASELMPRLDAALRAARAVFDPEVSFDPMQVSAEIRLAATEYVSALLLPPLMKKIKSEAPGVDFRVIPTNKLAVAEILRSGQADLALGVFEPYIPGFRSEALFDDDFVIVARLGHPILASRTKLTPLCFVDYDWMLVSPFGDSVGQVDDALQPLGICRRVRLTVPNFLQASEVASETGLVLALGRRLAMRNIQRLPLGWRELPLTVRGFTTNMMWVDQRNSDPLLLWVRQQIAGAVKALA